MSYIKGEEKITKTVKDAATIEKVFNFLMAHKKKAKVVAAFGSTRFDSHGYVAFMLSAFNSVPIWKAQRKFPNIEFKISADGKEGELPHWLYVEYRTKGSTGWHPGH